MDRIRKLCYNLGNCTVIVYLLVFGVITCYRADGFNLLTPNPSGAANFWLCQKLALSLSKGHYRIAKKKLVVSKQKPKGFCAACPEPVEGSNHLMCQQKGAPPANFSLRDRGFARSKTGGCATRPKILPWVAFLGSDMLAAVVRFLPHKTTKIC